MRAFICLILFIFGSYSIIAQSSDFQVLGKSIHSLKEPVKLNPLAHPRFLPLHAGFLRTKSTPNSVYPYSKTFSISEQYYEHLGFFCKAELRLEQASRIPIKIRLGEVQYVERMEGKYD